MNTLDLIELIGHTPDQYLLSTMEETRKRLPAKRIWLIAAIIIILSVLAGCIAYAWTFNDLILFKQPFEYSKIEETEPQAVISLHGVASSKAYLAAKEWLEWKHTYDPEMKLYSEEACSTFPEEYRYFTVYTQEMKDKLDDICQKYDVQLTGKRYYDTDNTYVLDALQIDGICRADTNVQTNTHIRYIYANGSFAANCTITLDKTLWPESLLADVTCYHKDVFDEVNLTIAALENYQQWNYTTPDGNDVLLALGADRALIFAQTGDWFFAITGIDTKTDNSLDSEYAMSKDVLEAIANVFDFNIQPKSPSEAYFSESAARLEAEETQQQNEAFAFEQTHKEWIGAASFEARVRFHLENDAKATQLEYAFKDLDRNGTEELLIGYDGDIYHIYSQRDGETHGILDWNNPYPAYLAEDGTLVVSFTFRSEGVYQSSLNNFYRIENGIEVLEMHIEHNPEAYKDTESPWWLTDADRKSKPITEEEYHNIISSKKRISIEMMPLTEYTL